MSEDTEPGGTPAESGGEAATPAAWVEANRHRLPRTYAEFSRFPIAHRRAIYNALGPSARSALWVEQLTRYLDANPGLPAEQRQVLTDAMALLRDERAHRHDAAGLPLLHEELRRLEARGIAAFGRDRARDLFATLGPPEGGPPPR
ncbi:phage tail protein X [Thermocatellispora tengchongensis]|uniref:Phage tail protein X n=1 Tax=Thermocatellispora tengchongensis TaxID=1073253 RepID=A0A840P6R4_9ACTN|nr:bacteriocin fulvocin C-related protein [Thermocatellispora tengchongensis]MBB5135012.1 phage tail protein X [Thermocatellispora tengchongensis]